MTWSWLSLRFPRDVSPTAGLAALLAINGLSTPRRRDFLVLQAVGRDSSVTHQLRVPAAQRAAIVRQLTTHLPGLVVEVSENDQLPTVDRAWRAWQTSRERSLNTDQPEALAHGLLAALSAVEADELVCVQWLLGPVRRPQAVGARVRGSHPGLIRATALSALVGPADLDAEARRALRLKQGLPGWRAVLQIGVAASGAARQRQLLGHVAAAIRVAQGPGIEVGFDGLRPDTMTELRQPWQWGLRINVAELLGLTAWPLGETAHLPVPRVRSRSLPTPTAVPRQGLVIGDSSYGADPRPVALSRADSLMHTHLIGATGSGKSTLMVNMIAQAMQANRAVCVIEPKGDLIQDVLARVPDHRLDDVVLIDPTDAHPVGLNPLAQAGVPGEVITDQILAVFKGLFGEAIGPRTQDLLSAGLLTLTNQPGMSLVALPLLFTNAAFRHRLVHKLHDPLTLGPFWAFFESSSASEQAAMLAPLMNKVRHLLLRPRLRRVIGQSQPRFDIRDLYRHRRIVLVNLNKGVLGPESAGLLGSLVVSMVWQATLGRAEIPRERRHVSYLFLDEFADFVHLPQDFGDVLTQARGLGAAVVAAHQHLAQLTPTLRAAVLANARTRVVFTVSQDDAGVLTKGDSRLKPEDLASLGRYEAYASVLADSEPQAFASIRTRPAPPALRKAEAAAARSREHYGVPAEEIDAALEALVRVGEPKSGPRSTPDTDNDFGVRPRRPQGREGDDR